MIDGAGPPPDPRADRFFGLERWLRTALLAAGILATASLVAGEEYGPDLGALTIAVLVGVPLGRVLWLVLRWSRRGDTRFAIVGAGVLGVVAVGALLGLLSA